MIYESLKRTMDIVAALLLLILFSPIMIITALLIKHTSPGPIFADIPKRVGKNGEMFHLYKFRSMIVNAYNLLRTDPRFKKAYVEQQESGNYKIMKDPRVTPIGKFIRKYSIDEMPQLLNVIKGDMSLVGPRPYYPEELKIQQKHFPETKNLVKLALSVKPGVTGYWQVSGRASVNFDKRIKIDAEYARTRSLLFDLKIICLTPWAMVSGKGAV